MKRKVSVTRTCKFCASDFEAWKATADYCSQSCRGRARYRGTAVRAPRTCDECTSLIANELRADSRFCSPRCRSNFNARKSNIRKMGIQPEAFDAMLAAQGGTCAVTGCDKSANENGRRLHIDHDHDCCPGRWSCGECVRGLLCDRHNLILGLIDDDIDGLLALVDYLTASRIKAVA
jgi:hypothetical protein